MSDNTTPALNALMPTARQFKDFMELPDTGPIVMCNLLKFKPNGGDVEYAKYAAAIQPILERIGARLLFAGKAEFCLIGTGDWDQVALVEYPNRQSLLDMSRSADYQAIHHHREAGLEGQINYQLKRVV